MVCTMRTLCELGVSYRNASSDVRDRVSFTSESTPLFLAKLGAIGIGQVMVLSTCNRCEIFFWGDGSSIELCRETFVSEFVEVDLDSVLEVRLGKEAFDYLFRIAAGLESMIIGEYQILGQVKDAYALSLSGGYVGKELDRILRDAISCAKRVKTELDIGAVPPSVCRAGMDFVDRISGIAGKRVFVIGSGKTGSLAARLASGFGASLISVCNRSRERVKKLVDELNVAVVDYAMRYEAIDMSDIVISATASPHVVVRAERLRLGHPVTFLDLASPRDIDPDIMKDPFVRLVSIDTIGELASGDRQERERLVGMGMKIVNASVDETMTWLREAVHRKETFL